MRKKMMLVSMLVVLATIVCVNAYAAEGQVSAWHGLWNSVGGFLYNALPWNWGNWVGK